MLHLMVQCPFLNQVWFDALHKVDLQSHTPSNPTSILDWWAIAGPFLPISKRKMFCSLVSEALWQLWLEENNRVFENGSHNVQVAVSKILKEWKRIKLVRSGGTDEWNHLDAR